MSKEDEEIEAWYREDRARVAQWKAERLAQEEQEKDYRRKHRKWLKETKPERDVEKARERAITAVTDRIHELAFEASFEVADKAARTAVADLTPEPNASGETEYSKKFHRVFGATQHDVYLSIYRTAAVAAEIAAAQAVGFESWSAFKAAEVVKDQKEIAKDGSNQTG